MTREEIDVLWQQARETSVKDGLHTARYAFANLILEKAAENCLPLDSKVQEFQLMNIKQKPSGA